MDTLDIHVTESQGTTWLLLKHKGSTFLCYIPILSDNTSMSMTVFPTPGCHITISATSLDTIASAPRHGRHPQEGAVQVWEQSNWWFWRYCYFCVLPLFSDHLRHGHRTDPQQFITQSAQATADTIASALTAQTTSISLPIYDWDLKDAYHSFSIFDALWKTGSFSTAVQLTVRTTSNTSSQPWEPNPWSCMYTGYLLEMTRNKEWPRWKLLLSLKRYNREWHTMSTPMYN